MNRIGDDDVSSLIIIVVIMMILLLIIKLLIYFKLTLSELICIFFLQNDCQFGVNLNIKSLQKRK